MNQNTRVLNKFEYFVEDCDCSVCLFWQNRKRGCALDHCCCQDIKNDALAHGRINREPGFFKGVERW